MTFELEKELLLVNCFFPGKSGGFAELSNRHECAIIVLFPHIRVAHLPLIFLLPLCEEEGWGNASVSLIGLMKYKGL